jgi:hypothetical protein
MNVWTLTEKNRNDGGFRLDDQVRRYATRLH